MGIAQSRPPLSAFHVPLWNGCVAGIFKTNTGELSLSYIEKTLGLAHQTAFNMRYKLLTTYGDFFRESPWFWGISLNSTKPSCLTVIKGNLFTKQSVVQAAAIGQNLPIKNFMPYLRNISSLERLP